MNLLHWSVLSLIVGDVYGVTRGEPGTHCASVSSTTGTVEVCAQCFFPQNCLGNNHCLLGSRGPLCENCQHHSSTAEQDLGYYRVANICTPCSSFPWSLIGFSIFMFLIISNVIYNGLNTSLATKIKQMVDFLQYIILSASIKVPWSSVVSKAAVIFQFSFFSASLATPGCILHLPDLLELYYLEWGVSVILIVIIMFVVLLLDKQSHIQLKTDPPLMKQRSIWRKRSQYRRCAFLTLMVMYVPVTVSAIQSFSCTGSLFPTSLMLLPNRELFLYNLAVDCDHVTFAAVNSLFTLILIFYSCLLPLVLLFFTLRQSKWKLLHTKFIKYGCVYEMYKDRCCWWETLVMLRKLVYILLTYTYPISEVSQAFGHLAITGFMLIITLIIRPYRKFTWKMERFHKASPSVIFEVLSTVCILLLDVDAVLTAYGIPTVGLDWTFFSFLLITLFFWLGCFLSVKEERQTPALVEFQLPGYDKSDSLTTSTASSTSRKTTSQIEVPTINESKTSHKSEKMVSTSSTDKKEQLLTTSSVKKNNSSRSSKVKTSNIDDF